MVFLKKFFLLPDSKESTQNLQKMIERVLRQQTEMIASVLDKRIEMKLYSVLIHNPEAIEWLYSMAQKKKSLDASPEKTERENKFAV